MKALVLSIISVLLFTTAGLLGKSPTQKKTDLYTEIIDLVGFEEVAGQALDEAEKNYKEIADAMINEEIDSYHFSTWEEAQDFTWFFYRLYDITYQNADDGFFTTQENNGNIVVKYYKGVLSESPEKRVATMQAVIDRVGLEEWEDESEEVQAITDRIHSHMQYDSEYRGATMEEALRDGLGVCVHHATQFYIIANQEGIPCEIIFGDYVLEDGSVDLHAWCEVTINGEKYDVDPTGSGFIEESEAWRYKAM